MINEAIALLDQDGEAALTFRALASRLGGGVGSIYWYVANKDELVDRASDHVLGSVLETLGDHDLGDDPIDAMRTIATTLYDTLIARRWLAAYFMRTSTVQPNAMRIFELCGQAAMRLELTPRQAFHAVSSVVGFVVGTAADLGQRPTELPEGAADRDEFLLDYADQWRELPADEYPFIHYIVEEFATHDDGDQFRAGLDLILSGLRLQAGS